MNISETLSKHALTAGVVVIAILAVLFKSWEYLGNPWTRNGMVRAIVIQVTPRVSGPIVELPIVDNQAVQAGDLLFRIDPRTFQENLDSTTAEETRTAADFERGQDLIKTGDISKRDYDAATAAYDVAKANKESARLDLEFTEVRASVDGFITNLDLRIGSQAVANQPVMALVDKDSFWIDGYFRETTIGNIRPGDMAVVTLMTYPDKPLTGTVDSIGWGIAQADGSTSYELLPAIEPTFEWIRLAQRVPVRIHLDSVPDDVKLRVGTTASVLVKTGE
jgi:RND family efflux transporter MFP subunit